MGTWVDGRMCAWAHGSMSAWAHGCIGAWLHECMGAWVWAHSWVYGSCVARLERMVACVHWHIGCLGARYAQRHGGTAVGSGAQPFASAHSPRHGHMDAWVHSRRHGRPSVPRLLGWALYKRPRACATPMPWKQPVHVPA
eukprot:356293-Chlamydomonas_euryale.AAC.5